MEGGEGRLGVWLGWRGQAYERVLEDKSKEGKATCTFGTNIFMIVGKWFK